MRSHNGNEYKAKNVCIHTHTHTHTHTHVCMTESISLTLFLQKSKVIQHCKLSLFQQKNKIKKQSHRSIKKNMIFFYYVGTCEENLNFLNH